MIKQLQTANYKITLKFHSFIVKEHVRYIENDGMKTIHSLSSNIS